MRYVDIISVSGAPRFRHAWRADEHGAVSTHAAVQTGHSAITFDNPGEALALATAALAAYQALTRLEADPALAAVDPADVDLIAIGQAAWAIGEVLDHAAAGVDSDSWECQGCGGRGIGGRPLAGLCRGCQA